MKGAKCPDKLTTMQIHTYNTSIELSPEPKLACQRPKGGLLNPASGCLSVLSLTVPSVLIALVGRCFR